MPEIRHFLGVNSVTNIEPPKGFMPALICIFADWFEYFCVARALNADQHANHRSECLEGAHRKAIWLFAPSAKTSGILPIY
ncbi:hypothetical protein VRB78_18785 [Pseudomonas trivialis]|uniref:hypothetical protein n=1 Tax=Pseudomonas trivialis TaxID=200450 RepID=UPI0030CE57BF